jgi:hypothetical protein
MRCSKVSFVTTGLWLLMLASLGAFARVQASSTSAVGTWRLDTAKSSYGNMPPPKFEQLVITADEPTALKWNLKGMSADGKTFIESYDGPIDGKDHRLVISTGGTIAYTRVATGVQWVIKGSDGAVLETASGQISPDGKTLTIQGTMQGSNGKVNFVSVYNRVQ